MRVRFFAYVRDKDYAGCKEITRPACRDLRALGEELSEAYGEKFRSFCFTPDGSDFGANLIILVNGRRAEFLDGINTVLKDSDTVLIFPVVAGG